MRWIRPVVFTMGVLALLSLQGIVPAQAEQASACFACTDGQDNDGFWYHTDWLADDVLGVYNKWRGIFHTEWENPDSCWVHTNYRLFS